MQIALIATHHCDYAANLARSPAARPRVSPVPSARGARRPIASLRARHVHSCAPISIPAQGQPNRLSARPDRQAGPLGFGNIAGGTGAVLKKLVAE